MMISIEAEQQDKIRMLSWIKFLPTSNTREFNLPVKDILKSPTISVFSSERLNALSLRSGLEQGYPTLTSSQYCPGGSSQYKSRNK